MGIGATVEVILSEHREDVRAGIELLRRLAASRELAESADRDASRGSAQHAASSRWPLRSGGIVQCRIKPLTAAAGASCAAAARQVSRIRGHRGRNAALEGSSARKRVYGRHTT